MDGLKIKNDIFQIKTRLTTVEEDLKLKIYALSIKEEKWVEFDSVAERMKKDANIIVKFNICGKKFMTRIQTLLDTKDTLFYKLLISGEISLDQEIFFDRDPKYFSIILDYLRTKRINLKRFSSQEIKSLRNEVIYFEIGELLELIGNEPTNLEFESFDFSGAYVVSGITIGTNKVEDLTDISCMKGICTKCPGSITINLNKEAHISSLEIGGFRGNTTYWSCENGAYASIKVSSDKINWTPIGQIPSGYGSSIKTVSFTKTLVKYIKFEYNSYLGIGYLNLKQI